MASQELKTGDRRTATVLFSDMKGFTSLSEGMDPEQIDGLMNRVFARFEEIIKSYGGYVEKYIGDALVAVFGYPAVHEDDTDRALGAALDFHDSLAESEPRLQFRSGVHSGLVTTGRRGEYQVVTGHALAIASRLQHKAPAGGILVSGEVVEKAGRSFRFSPGETIEVDGKEETVTAHHLSGRTERAFYFEGSFVGREDAVQYVIKKYMETSGTGVGALLITGDAGLGKTRLAVQAVSEIAAFPRFASPTILTRTPLLRRGPYDALRQFLERLIDSVPGIPSKNRERFEPFLAGGQWDGGRESLFAEVRDVMAAIANANPTPMYAPIVFIDVASGLSPEERDLLRFMIEDRTSPFFFLLTDRREEGDLARIFPAFEVLRLGPLTEHETSDLVHALAPERAIDAADIHARSGGTPLFVEELVKYLVRGDDTDELPATINNVILASLERFSATDREILKKASVFRVDFSAEQLTRLHVETGGDASEIGPALQRLQADRLLIPSGGGLVFRYGTIRNVVYRTILNHNKRVLHGVVGKLLEELGQGPGCTVHHYIQAGTFGRAAELILASAKTHQFELEFVPHIDRILESEVGQDDNLRVQLLYAKYAALYNHDEREGIDDLVGEILAVGFRTRDRRVLGRGYHLLMASAASRHDREAAILYGSKALFHYSAAEQSDRADNVRSFMTWQLLALGRVDEAFALVQDMEEAWHVDMELSALYLSTGKLAEAADATERFEKAAHGRKDEAVSKYLKSSIALLYSTGQFEAILERLPTIQGLTESDFPHIAILYAYVSLSYSLTGQRERGTHFLKKAIYFAKQKESAPWLQAMLAEAFLALGETDKAETYARAALEEGLVSADHGTAIEVLVLLGRIALGAHDRRALGFYVDELGAYREGPYHIGPILENQILYMEYRSCGNESSLIRAAESVNAMLNTYGERFGRDTLLRIPLASEILAAAESVLIQE